MITVFAREIGKKICSHTCIPPAQIFIVLFTRCGKECIALSHSQQESTGVGTAAEYLLMMMRMFRVVGSFTQVVPRFVAVSVQTL